LAFPFAPAIVRKKSEEKNLAAFLKSHLAPLRSNLVLFHFLVLSTLRILIIYGKHSLSFESGFRRSSTLRKQMSLEIAESTVFCFLDKFGVSDPALLKNEEHNNMKASDCLD
jgi:hypothetical protein